MYTFLSYITFQNKTTKTFEDYTKDNFKKTKHLISKYIYGKTKRNKSIYLKKKVFEITMLKFVLEIDFIYISRNNLKLKI